MTRWRKDISGQRCFKVFYDYIGPAPTPKHQIDRIDNNKNYEPGNVRWTTSKVNCNNRRTRNATKP